MGTLTEVLAGLIIWILGCLTLLQQVFEVDIRAILAALGVGGLAVALALQDTLSNLFAGFYVSVARQIRIGDFVKIDAGQSGYVQDIGWRSTTLRELSGNLIFIPNNKLSQSIVTNYYLPERRVGIGITVPVAYDSDAEPGGTPAERSGFRRGRASSGSLEGACASGAIHSRFRGDFDGLHFGLPGGRVRRPVSGAARASQADSSPVSSKKAFDFARQGVPAQKRKSSFLILTAKPNGRTIAAEWRFALYVLPSTIEGR